MPFPPTPIDGELHTEGGKTHKYNDTYGTWVIQNQASITQQNSLNPGNNIFVVLSGDSLPAAGTKGNILIQEN